MMSAICNGLAAYGGFIPFGATFLNFIGYALGAVTLSALSHLQVFSISISIYILIINSFNKYLFPIVS